MKLLKIYFLFVFCSVSFAQIDTTVYYPLQIGNKWQYYGISSGYTNTEIIGDTIMPNGFKYFIFDVSENVPELWRFQRNKNKSSVFFYSIASQNEYKLFDFNANEKSIWLWFPRAYYWGINRIWQEYDYLFGKYLENSEYTYLEIDSTVTPPDTLWGIVDIWPTLVTKYVGVSSLLLA